MAHVRPSLFLVAAVVSAAALAAAWEAPALAAIPARRVQAPAHRLCVDEKGAKYSPGALRHVSSQLQACDFTGAWVFGPSGEPDDPMLAKAKSCRSEDSKDKDQEYAPGLLRSDGLKFKRCDNGKWVPAPPKGASTGSLVLNSKD